MSGAHALVAGDTRGSLAAGQRRRDKQGALSTIEEHRSTPMITAIVQFDLPSPISLEEAARRFESSAPKYQHLAGLLRKYYIRSTDGRVAGGVYLWQSREAAERVYDGEWRARVETLYGAPPRISWFDTPVVVDNVDGGTITKAA
jgi:hypothetical protein